MFWGLIIGVLLGYFFKPQIDQGVKRISRMIRDDRGSGGSSY
jgi:hypothetical protein